MRGLYQHLKRSVGLSGRQAGGQQFVADKNGVLLRNRDDILQRWARFFSTLLNTKSPTLNPDIIERVTQRPATRDTQRLGQVPELEEVERATKGLKNWKACPLLARIAGCYCLLVLACAFRPGVFPTLCLSDTVAIEKVDAEDVASGLCRTDTVSERHSAGKT